MRTQHFDLDKYLSDTFDFQDRNCWHFAADVWFDLTGVRLHAFIEDASIAALNQLAEYKADGLRKLNEAVSPCLVLMQRRLSNPHIGVFYNGKILHLNEKGASYVPLHIAVLGYNRVSYYK